MGTMSKHNWSEADKAFLIAVYATTKTSDIATQLGLSVKAVYSQSFLMGLKKDSDFLSSEAAGRFQKNRKYCEKHQFKKGQVSWNKGKKGLFTSNAKTKFKKGDKPHNTKYDGFISTHVSNKDGKRYQYLRLGERKWVLLHRYIWEQANGPIPKGMIITFKDGNELNADLSNLELISKAENMKRNTIHRLPPELVSTIKVLSSLKRKIKTV